MSEPQNIPIPTPNAFLHFAAASDTARATPSKLQKTAALAAYLRTLGKEDVGTAARFLAAQPFAPSSSKSLGVGGALVVGAVHEIAAIDRATLHRAFHEHGEIGEALSAYWPTPPDNTPPLTLPEIQAAFIDLAATGIQDQKRNIVTRLLRRCANREAVYLVKIILGDMRTGVSEGIIESAIAEAFDAKLAAVRAARLLVGDLDAVAELAIESRLDKAQFRPFVPLGYMLAQPIMTAAEIIDTLANRPAIAEDKFDGIRAQLHVSTQDNLLRVELFSRGSGAVTASFPDIITPIHKWAQSTGKTRFVLDGEIIPARIAHDSTLTVLPFSSLQKRLGRKTLTPKTLRENPAAFIAFDCLWLDGNLLLDRPLNERREKLTELLAKEITPQIENRNSKIENPLPLVMSTAAPVTDAPALESLFAAARSRRNEGLVIKRLDSPYTPGRRGDAWLKLKSHLPTLDVVVVAAERGHGKRRDVLSDVTFAVRASTDDPTLLTVGKAYTGLTDAEIAALTERFERETIETRGRTRTVHPTVVLEIAFDQITKSTRHSSGYAMRFPRIVRIRDDKSPNDIDTLERLRQIFLSPDNLALTHEGERPEAPPTDADQMSLF
ncbi:MAG: ATP-dependent DNA ligase [Phycisphaerae bacterium]